MQLYALERVTAAENSTAFQEAQRRARRRSEAAKQVARHKEEEMLKAVRAMPITVQRLPLGRVRKNAIRAYNDYQIARGQYDDLASSTSDRAFLERITVNYIRHELTDYDRKLEGTAGRVGVRKAEQVIRARVHEAIAAQYPVYAAECRRQQEARATESSPSVK